MEASRVPRAPLSSLSRSRALSLSLSRTGTGSSRGAGTRRRRTPWLTSPGGGRVAGGRPHTAPPGAGAKLGRRAGRVWRRGWRPSVRAPTRCARRRCACVSVGVGARVGAGGWLHADGREMRERSERVAARAPPLPTLPPLFPFAALFALLYHGQDPVALRLQAGCVACALSAPVPPAQAGRLGGGGRQTAEGAAPRGSLGARTRSPLLRPSRA